jgi:threonine dehydratase
MVKLEAIREAAQRIANHVRYTPVVRCATLDRMFNAELYFKCENLQAAGAFKSRGACNAVFALPDKAAARGVATHSSGNHAAALSRAAARRGIAAHIVMPRTARPGKIDAVRAYGGSITFCEPTLADRESTADGIVARTGANFIHPYDDDRIIAGQGTAALEMLDRHPDLEIVIAPVGGGGLLSGTAIAAKSLRPSIQVWGGEPAGADDAFQSWKAGRRIPAHHPQSIADGLLTSLGHRNFRVIQERVDEIVLVQDSEIERAMSALYEHADLLVEPSGAVPLAVLWRRADEIRGRRIGILLSGGNITLADLPGSPPNAAPASTRIQ